GPVLVLELEGDLEPVPAERGGPHEHEDGFEPLLAVQHVVNELALVFPPVQEDGGQREPLKDRLDQLLAVGLVPDALPLEPRLQVQVVLLLEVPEFEDGLGAELDRQLLGHSWAAFLRARLAGLAGGCQARISSTVRPICRASSCTKPS